MVSFADAIIPDRGGATWSIHGRIGEGGQGAIFAASKIRRRCTDCTYAIKMIPVINGTAQIINNEQILLRKRLSHPNICVPVEFFTVQHTHCIVLEMLEFTLERIIMDKTHTFSGVVVLNHILRGILYLHSNNVMHRDLKTSNIMFRKGVAIIIDFGWSIDCSHADADVGVEIKPWTLWYRPPEVALKVEFQQELWYDTSADLWSVGLIGIEMLWKRAVFPCRTDTEVELISQMCSLFRLKTLSWENFRQVEQPASLLDVVRSQAVVPDPGGELASISCCLLVMNPNGRRVPPIDFVEDGSVVDFVHRYVKGAR